jgi:hydroxymethylbilane synthase
MAQLKATRPDLVFADLRGNLDTRLAKLEGEAYDAIVVAAAGMDRLEKPFDDAALLPTETCLPAAGQGVLALECREQDDQARALASSVDHETTRAAAQAERAFLARLGGGCSTPMGVLALSDDEGMWIRAALADPEGRQCIRAETRAPLGRERDAAEGLADGLRKECQAKGVEIES